MMANNAMNTEKTNKESEVITSGYTMNANVSTSWRLVKLWPLSKSLLTEYLRYVIADLSFTDYIKPILTGVSIPHISPSQINDYMFRIPPVELQNKIAAILSSYDDLIENNTRRIKILEEMAQALYGAWFLKFRFPGHEKVKMVESGLGPEDREKQTFITIN